MYKLILLTFTLGVILFVTPYRETYQAKIEPIQTKQVKKVAVKTVKRVYKAPTGQAKELIEYVSQETGYTIDQISKIAWSESDYNLSAVNVNKNGSKDYSLLQINSQHIPEAKKLGLDITKPLDNAKFAIVLIKRNGLRDWVYSKSVWSVL